MKPQDLQDTAGNMSPNEGGRTALHVACMRESDHHVSAPLTIRCLTAQSWSRSLCWHTFLTNTTWSLPECQQNCGPLAVAQRQHWPALERTLTPLARHSNRERPGKASHFTPKNSTVSLHLKTGPASSTQAVEELLNGGADPNTRLGPRVGSALCALTNFHYRLCGNRAKLVHEYKAK